MALPYPLGTRARNGSCKFQPGKSQRCLSQLKKPVNSDQEVKCLFPRMLCIEAPRPPVMECVRACAMTSTPKFSMTLKTEWSLITSLVETERVVREALEKATQPSVPALAFSHTGGLGWIVFLLWFYVARHQPGSSSLKQGVKHLFIIFK